MSPLKRVASNVVELEDGNKAYALAPGTGALYTTSVAAQAFPAYSLLSFDFMIPEFPEDASDGAQVSIGCSSIDKQNYVSINYEADDGKWYAGVGDEDGVVSDPVKEIKAGVWYHTVIAFNTKASQGFAFIDGALIGRPACKVVGRAVGSSLFTIKTASYSGVANVATYYIDNLRCSSLWDEELIKITGYQKSSVENGTYKVRFICALPSLVQTESEIGFEVSSPSNGKEWTYTATTVYQSLSANYGTDTITASSLDAQALAVVAIHGIPESISLVELIVKPYVTVNGVKYYGSAISMNPSSAFVEYSGVFDANPVSSEEEDIVVDANGALNGKKVVILMGQSNMAGRGDVTTVETIDDDRIRMYRNGEFIKMTEPVFTDNAAAGTSLGAAFAKAYVETYNEDIVLIPGAVGGTSLAKWAPGDTLYNDTVEMVRAAVEQGGEVVAVLWCQGESESNTSKRVYLYRLADMIQHLYAEFGLDYETVPFIAGEMFSNASSDETSVYNFVGATNVNTYLQALTYSKTAEDNPLALEGVPADFIVGSEDIPLYGVAKGSCLRNIGDRTHLDAPSTRVYGYRYFNVFQELVGADADADGNIDYYDYADPLDIPEDERTLDAIGAVLDSYLISTETVE